MTDMDIRAYCLSKREAEEYYPFGEEPACFRVRGKIFAELYPSLERHWVTLKCEPMRADFYRRQYPGVVVRGYHCPPVQQPYNNTVSYDWIENEILLEMLDHAYARVVEGMPKYIQRQLAASEEVIS